MGENASVCLSSRRQLPRPSNGPVAGFEAALEEGQERPEDKERKGILEEEAACAQAHG